MCLPITHIPDNTYHLGLFFLIGIHSMQGWTATTRHGVTRKKAQKRLQVTENLLKTYSQKVSVNSGLKTTKIISQMKAFYRQRIPEFSCPRKETVDIDILATSRNDDRKIMQSIRIRSRPPSRKRKWNHISLGDQQTYCLQVFQRLY